MRGETQDAFLERMFAKADANRRFIRLEEEAALATVQAKKNPREHAAAVKAAQRRSTFRGDPAGTVRTAQLAKKREVRERADRARTPRPERIPVAQECKGTCGRMLRPKWARREQLPGTAAEHQGGKCWACFHGNSPRNKPPAECVGCGRAFRNKANPDGEVKHLSHGRCARCAYWADRPADATGVQGPLILPCVECQRPTRSSKHTLESAPGTVKRIIGGLCQTCWRAKQKDGRAEEYRRQWAKQKASTA